MVRRKIRGLAYPIITISILIMVIFLLALYIFTVVYEPSREGAMEHVPVFIIWTLVACGVSICILVMMAKPLLSIIHIDETGVSRAFLGRFWKLHIAWQDLAEARYFISVSEQMAFSKTKKLEYIQRNKWYKEKDIIFIGFSKKRYEVISQYLQQPIVGMPDKVKERLTKEKSKKS